MIGNDVVKNTAIGVGDLASPTRLGVENFREIELIDGVDFLGRIRVENKSDACVGVSHALMFGKSLFG